MEEVAEETGLSRRLVTTVYRAYWKAVRQHITSLPLKENLTDEEFSKLKPNVNIPSIGKLCVTLDRYHRVVRSYNKYESLLKENEENNQK